MIKINGKSIIHRQIESCLKVGIDNFIFVLGYKKEKLKNHILEKLLEKQITIIENNIYDKTNTLYSLWLCKNKFDDNFIYFNADVLFDADLLKKISSSSKYSQLLLETKSCAEEEVKMIIDDNFKILEIGKKLEIPKCAGEFIGVGKFNLDILPKFAKYLTQGIEENQENNYFEWAVNLLAKDVILTAIPTDDAKCIEIDFPEDLQLARKMFSK